MTTESNVTLSFFKTHWVRFLGVLGVVFPFLGFIIGHLSAYLYYSAWDLPYLKLTNASTGYSFLLESIEVSAIIFIIFIVLSLFLILSISMRLFPLSKEWERLNELKENKRKRMHKKLSLLKKFTLYFKHLMVIVLVVVTGTWLIHYIGNTIQSSYLKIDIASKNYRPFEIAFSKKTEVHKCVTALGSLGGYLVFTNELLQPILVRKEDINYIKPMLSTPPIKNFNGILWWDGILNPDFEKEQSQWLLAWDEICDDYVKSTKYQEFKFRKPPTRGQNRKPPVPPSPSEFRLKPE